MRGPNNTPNTSGSATDELKRELGFDENGVLSKESGGTGNKDGNAETATKLKNAREFLVDLASDEGEKFDGSEDAAPGVKNILPVKHGGTGKEELTPKTYLYVEEDGSLTEKTAAQVLEDIGAQPVTIGVVEVTGSITLSAVHLGKHLCCNAADAVTITIPAGLGAGFNCTVDKWGAGDVSIAADGVTINGAADTLTLGDQYDAAVSIIALYADIYSVKGGLA